MPEAEDQRRRAHRDTVCRAARITFGGSAVDCLVLDVSDRGARVRTAAAVSVPEQVSLHFHTGSIFPARRCWVRGMQLGFEFCGTVLLTGAASQQVRAAHTAFSERGPSEAILLLRAARFFDDPALRQMAEEVEAVQARFEAALRERAEAGAASRLAS